MPKRDRDTEIWKQAFYKALPPLYKCFWDYINDDCDNAGVWMVDVWVATKRIGKRVNLEMALELFGGRVEVFEGGEKWYIKGFIFEKLGFTDLSPSHKFQKSILDLLNKHKRQFFKGYPDTLQSVKDMGKDKDMSIGKGMGTEGGAGGFDEKFVIAFDDQTCERFAMTFKGYDLAAELQRFRTKCDNDPANYHPRDAAGLRAAFQYQLNTKPNGSSTKQKPIDKLAEAARIIEGRNGSL